MNVTVAVEDPRQDDIIALLDAGTRELRGIYPPEHSFLLDIDQLCTPQTTLVAARRDGALLGIGAIVAYDDWAEVKRMFVAVDARGQGIGERIIAALETQARAQGIAHLRLETGDQQLAAIRLYTRLGFGRCARFGDYPDDPIHVFMEKHLPPG